MPVRNLPGAAGALAESRLIGSYRAKNQDGCSGGLWPPPAILPRQDRRYSFNGPKTHVYPPFLTCYRRHSPDLSSQQLPHPTPSFD
jgi:hypothetical protein